MSEIIKALHKAKQSFTFAEKTGKGQYKPFASDVDIAKATDAALFDNGLTLIQCVVIENGKYYLEGTMYHVSGEHLEMGMYPLVNTEDPQKLKISVTYARRSQKTAFLDIHADPDDDAASISSGYSSSQNRYQSTTTEEDY